MRPTARRSMGTSSSLRTGPFRWTRSRWRGPPFTRPPARPWSRASSATAKNVVPAQGYSYGYGAGADRTVLIRWNGSAQADPIVKVGDFIADVTYERIQITANIASSHSPAPRGRRRGRAQPAEQRRMGQPAGAALLLVPGPEDHAGPGRPVLGLPLSIDGRLRQPEAGGADPAESSTAILFT